MTHGTVSFLAFRDAVQRRSPKMILKLPLAFAGRTTIGCCTPRRAMSAARSSIPSGEGRPRGLVFDGKMLSMGILNISPVTAGCVAMSRPFSPARNGVGQRFGADPGELGGNLLAVENQAL